MPLDIALAYDPINRRCDLVLGTGPSGGLDFTLDSTFQTPVLMSMGLNRRAHADDGVPQPIENLAQTAPLMNLRGGWPGDSLDTNGELTGSRSWVFSRSKLNTAIKNRVLASDNEALAWLKNRLGVAVTVIVERYNQNTLAHRITVGRQTLVVPQVLGA